MEISSKLLPYQPVPNQTSRPGETVPLKQRSQTEQEKNEATTGSLPPNTTGGQPAHEGQLDYRQLIRQARIQQFEGQQEAPSGLEAYRMGTEPLKVQQALGAYRDNATLEAGEGELMPRLDDYV